MSTTFNAELEATLRDRFPIPADIQRLANAARFDLWFGPTPADDEPDNDGWAYPGWSKAADLLQAWMEENLSTVWIGEESGCLWDTEPEGGYWAEDAEGEEDEWGEVKQTWVEDWEGYREFSLRGVAAELFGKELVCHIWA